MVKCPARVWSVGDRDAFFFKDMAHGLPWNTFRFDYPLYLADNVTFRYAAFGEDVSDLHEICTHLADQGYQVVGIVGHSRGN